MLWVLWAYVAAPSSVQSLGLGGATAAEQVGPASDTIRLAGGIGDANELAAILVPAVVIAAGLLVVTRTLLGRFVLFGFDRADRCSRSSGRSRVEASWRWRRRQ